MEQGVIPKSPVGCQRGVKSQEGAERRRIQGEVHQTASAYLREPESDSRVQAHARPCRALCLPFTRIKALRMRQLQSCLQGKDAFG